MIFACPNLCVRNMGSNRTDSRKITNKIVRYEKIYGRHSLKTQKMNDLDKKTDEDS